MLACMSFYLSSDDFNVKQEYIYRYNYFVYVSCEWEFFFFRCDQLCRNLMVLQRSHNKLFRVYRNMYVFNIFCADKILMRPK